MHDFTDFSTPDKEFITSRFREQINALEEVYRIASKKEATVIFGGDLFHKRGAVKTEIFNKVFELIERNEHVPTLMLRGNHDSVTNSLNSFSSIEPFSVLKNVTLFDTPETINIGVNVTFLPYGDETEEMKDFLKKEALKPKVNPTILVAHVGVEGATQGKHSHRLSGAFGYGDLQPRYFDFILLGHYHKRQQLTAEHNRHFYGGSFMQHNFGDEGQDKGVHLIDTDKGDVEFIPLNTTQFVTVQGNDVPDNLEDIMNTSFVRFLGSADEIKSLQKIQEMNKDTGLENIRIELQRDYTQEARMGLDASMSESDIVTKFAQNKYPNAVEEALECLQEAR